VITPDSPWWGLRQLQFTHHPAALSFIESESGSQPYETGEYYYAQYSPDQRQYETKFGGATYANLGNNVWVLTVQQPGEHKYDTAEAPFWIDTRTNLGWLLAEPKPSRQKSTARQNWKTIAQGLAFVLAVYGAVASVAGLASASSTVGGAILGSSTAAAYPALASAVGQIAITTALSGGDVEGAVKNFAISYAAGNVSGLVGAGTLSITDSDLLGKLAATVTRTYLAGGDVEQAAARALLQFGASYSGDSAMENFSDTEVIESGSIYMEGGQSYFDPWAISPTLDPAFTTQEFFTQTDAFNTPALDFQTQAPAAYSPPATASSYGWGDFNSAVQNLSQAALAALNVRSVYERITGPTVTQATRASGGTQTRVTDAGVVQTMGPDGRVTTSRPPIGQPHATTSGGFVINNGNGTFTLIDSQGVARTMPYGATAGPTNQTSPLMGGFLANIGPVPIALAVGGLLMLARRR
jgi:hypothetical protein